MTAAERTLLIAIGEVLAAFIGYGSLTRRISSAVDAVRQEALEPKALVGWGDKREKGDR